MSYSSVALDDLSELGSDKEVFYQSKIGAGCQAMEEGWTLVAVLPAVPNLDNALDADKPIFVFFKPAVEVAEPPIVRGQRQSTVQPTKAGSLLALSDARPHRRLHLCLRQ